MKIKALLEEDDEAIYQWFLDNCRYIHRSRMNVVDGKMNINGNLYLNCKEVKYPLGDVVLISCFEDGILESLKNMPTSCLDVDFGGQAISKIDQPLVSRDRINLAHCKIMSLKNIHKFLKCREITIWNNPVKDSILGLLMIPGIEIIDYGANSGIEDDPSYNNFHKALKIVAKYTGKGKQGILDAQQELIDNDLDDYAEA